MKMTLNIRFVVNLKELSMVSDYMASVRRSGLVKSS